MVVIGFSREAVEYAQTHTIKLLALYGSDYIALNDKGIIARAKSADEVLDKIGGLDKLLFPNKIMIGKANEIPSYPLGPTPENF